MRKFVWVPVVSLGREATGQFLEIMSEPTLMGGINMNALKNCGFNKNIAHIEAVLTQLSVKPSSAKLYLTGFLVNLSNTQGVNLGLLIACFMQAPACPYQKIIVTGNLDTEKLTVTDAVNFEAKIQTLLNLGKQAEPIAFFFPRVMLNENNAALLAPLAAMNIRLKPIDSLWDVLVDFGLTQVTEDA
ncbi:MAG: hypothetical protein HOP02_07570 [Methylococcaceae bacterium]|nr:hypothetical protein [Methylococcaceae bacterium]